MVALSFLVVALGTALLCFSMRRHYRLVSAAPLTRHRSLGVRGVGYALLAVGGWLCVADYGTGVGLTLFVGLFTVTMLGTALAATALGAKGQRHGDVGKPD